MLKVIKSMEFIKWFERLKDGRTKIIITDRLLRFEENNFGDAKSVGGGIIEARIHYGAGYRLYLIKHGEFFVVVLAGGDKSSQDKDIKKAKKLAEEWK